MDRAHRLGKPVTESDILPDVLADNLRVVFCGTAAGTRSAQTNTYYAHGGNKFWRVLSETGITPVQYQSTDFRNLLEHGVGLTDLFKSEYGMDHNIRIAENGGKARNALHAKILKHSPKFLAFTSMTAAKAYFAERREIGEQIETIGKTRIWILPSTSPAANWNWNAKSAAWHQLAKAVRAIR